MPFLSKDVLEQVYVLYNKRELVHPDPLEFLYRYPSLKDREIAGLIASSLAYGRVSSILKTVESVLLRMEPSPFHFLADNSLNRFESIFGSFKYRFTDGRELVALFSALKEIYRQYDSLESAITPHSEEDEPNALPALKRLVSLIMALSGLKKSSLISDPNRGSACKRLNLFLRWMTRNDDVDPGGWSYPHRSKLIVPLDTHMYHFGCCYGFTSRKSPDMKTALEITEGFKRLSPDDPVRYDFSLTRFGIRQDMCWENLDDLISNRPYPR